MHDVMLGVRGSSHSEPFADNSVLFSLRFTITNTVQNIKQTIRAYH
jgi:hypothetical protein